METSSKNNFLNRKIFTPQDARSLNALELAFVGDSVYSLYIKNFLVKKPSRVNTLTKKASKYVNARAQEEAYFKIQNHLSDEERDVVMRARNAKINSKAKNFSLEEYRHATAFEALIGYLYLTGNDERLNKVFSIIDVFGEKDEV